MRYSILLIFILFTLFNSSCAKRGTISGGLKDTIPPTLRQSLPPNYSTGFKGNIIKLNFDEYVKLKDINKQLIISPPLERAPLISPSTASKTINIRFLDTLQSNTTYSLNFGQSIQDNNEGNPFPQFKYVFSTGSYLDSLSLAGRIRDAYSKTVDNYVSVMLYEINDNYTDSIIYNKPPRYITNTLDSTKVWQLENLKAGKYLLIALKDANNNNRYNPKSDKIGFHKEFITIPNDTLFELELFNELPPFKTLKPSQAARSRIVMGYEGNPKDISVKLFNNADEIASIASKLPDSDSLQIWFPTIKTDSLLLKVNKAEFTSEYTVKLRAMKKDTLSFKPSVSGVLPLREPFKINSSIPISTLNSDFISVISKDSINVPFKTEYDSFNQNAVVQFTREPEQKYEITLLPGAIKTFYDQVNDTLNYKLTTKRLSDYGNLRVTLENVQRFPIIVELTDVKGTVKATMFSDKETLLNFDSIEPAIYTLRLIYDDNGNREWDAGSFLEKRQSEQVIYYPMPIDVRANWDWEQIFTLP